MRKVKLLNMKSHELGVQATILHIEVIARNRHNVFKQIHDALVDVCSYKQKLSMDSTNLVIEEDKGIDITWAHVCTIKKTHNKK